MYIYIYIYTDIIHMYTYITIFCTITSHTYVLVGMLVPPQAVAKIVDMAAEVAGRVAKFDQQLKHKKHPYWGSVSWDFLGVS